MKRFLFYLFYIIIIFYLVYCLLFPNNIRISIYTSLELFVTIILPSFIPMYILSHLLNKYPFHAKILFPILKPFLHFENEVSCSIWLSSIISGNPITGIIINQNVSNNSISLNEGNRLLKFSSFMSPLFIINIANSAGLNFNYILALVISPILASIIIGIFNTSRIVSNNKVYTNNTSIFDIIQNLPLTLLNILTVIIFVSLIKIPLSMVNINYPYSYVLDLLEITTGSNNIISYSISNFYKVLLLTFIINTNSISIILQTILAIKNEPLTTHNGSIKLNVITFVFFRLIQAILATFICYLIISLNTFF